MSKKKSPKKDIILEKGKDTKDVMIYLRMSQEMVGWIDKVKDDLDVSSRSEVIRKILNGARDRIQIAV